MASWATSKQGKVVGHPRKRTWPEHHPSVSLCVVLTFQLAELGASKSSKSRSHVKLLVLDRGYFFAPCSLPPATSKLRHELLEVILLIHHLPRSRHEFKGAHGRPVSRESSYGPRCLHASPRKATKCEGRELCRQNRGILISRGNSTASSRGARYTGLALPTQKLRYHLLPYGDQAPARLARPHLGRLAAPQQRLGLRELPADVGRGSCEPLPPGNHRKVRVAMPRAQACQDTGGALSPLGRLQLILHRIIKFAMVVRSGVRYPRNPRGANTRGTIPLPWTSPTLRPTWHKNDCSRATS